MEGGRKFRIPLDSPIDANSNDMLVSAEHPKFSFNRQRLLGSKLQTSVRYEDDGWFAGWLGHKFVLGGGTRAMPMSAPAFAMPSASETSGDESVISALMSVPIPDGSTDVEVSGRKLRVWRRRGRMEVREREKRHTRIHPGSDAVYKGKRLRYSVKNGISSWGGVVEKCGNAFYSATPELRVLESTGNTVKLANTTQFDVWVRIETDRSHNPEEDVTKITGASIRGPFPRTGQSAFNIGLLGRFKVSVTHDEKEAVIALNESDTVKIMFDRETRAFSYEHNVAVLEFVSIKLPYVRDNKTRDPRCRITVRCRDTDTLELDPADGPVAVQEGNDITLESGKHYGIISRHAEGAEYTEEHGGYVDIVEHEKPVATVALAAPIVPLAVSTGDLSYITTDIRTGITEEAYKRDTSDVQMYVKHKWSATVDTENFWWVDATHILELTKSRMILWKKTSGLDPWMGDKWEEQWSVPRGDWVGTGDLKYGVSSAYNSEPYFYKIQAPSADQVRILHSPCLSAVPAWTQVGLPVMKVELGDILHDDKLTAYAAMDAAALVSQAKVSASSVGGVLLIGLALSRGLRQWTVKIRGASRPEVVTGYGHVGVNGCLTGGMLPEKCVDGTRGITVPVKPLSSLSGAGMDSGLFGTESQTWFVYYRIERITTHFEFSGGSWNPVSIQLTSSVSKDYEDVSFSNMLLGKMRPRPYGIQHILAEMFNDGNLPLVIEVIGALILPNAWALNPMFSMMGYISHAAGLYAYAYRTSTGEYAEKGPGDRGPASAVSDRDIKFAEMEYKVMQEVDSHKGGIFMEILQLIIKSVDLVGGMGANWAASKLSANSERNSQTTDGDKGPSASQFFMDNIVGTAVGLLTPAGTSISLKSTIKTSATLDMFYSVSDKSQVWAGPGFTSLSFVGQCVAQSVSDLQAKGNRLGYWITLRELSLGIVRIQAGIFKAGAYYAALAAEAIASAGPPSSGGGNVSGFALFGLSVAWEIITIFGEIMAIVAKVLEMYSKFLREVGIPFVRGMCDALGPEKGTGYDAGGISAANLSIEGTHSYGNKPMQFMWPCWGIQEAINYTDEGVTAVINESTQDMNFSPEGPLTSLGSPDGPHEDWGDPPIINGGPLVPDVDTDSVKPPDMDSLKKEAEKYKELGEEMGFEECPGSVGGGGGPGGDEDEDGDGDPAVGNWKLVQEYFRIPTSTAIDSASDRIVITSSGNDTVFEVDNAGFNTPSRYRYLNRKALSLTGGAGGRIGTATEFIMGDPDTNSSARLISYAGIGYGNAPSDLVTRVQTTWIKNNIRYAPPGWTPADGGVPGNPNNQWGPYQTTVGSDFPLAVPARRYFFIEGKMNTV